MKWRRAFPLLLALSLQAGLAGAAEEGCSAAFLARLDRGETCRLLESGRLAAPDSSGVVLWRLYATGRGDPAPSGSAAATGIELLEPGGEALLSLHTQPWVSWFAPPSLIDNPEHGAFLLVSEAMGYDRLLLRLRERWVAVDTRLWQEELERGLPAGSLPLGGPLPLDYRTLSGSAAVRHSSGLDGGGESGTLSYRLTVVGEPPALRVAATSYRPRRD